MGIEGLETFINDGHRSISQKISIPVEIAKWRREHGTVPTVMVDLKEFLRAIENIDEGGLILGGRFAQIIETFEYFFGAIEPHANLVFFAMLNEGKFRDIKRFQTNDSAYDYIEHHMSLEHHFDTNTEHKWWDSSTLRPNERTLHNLLKIAQNYGKVVANYGSTKGAILMYARQNHDNVLALISRDTEFLVYDGDFQFWSISNIDFRNITIVRFCRRKLLQNLPLYRNQMHLLCALTQLRPDARQRICGGDGSLLWCVSYVKRQDCGQNGYESSEFIGQFTDDQRKEVQDELGKLKFVYNYAGSWKSDIYNDYLKMLISNDHNFKVVLKFCKNNIYFAYKLMNETLVVQKDLLFVDIRRSDSGDFLDMMVNVTLKLCGVIFKDVDPAKRPKTRIIYLRMDGKAKPRAEPVKKRIIYPNSLTLPSLKDLIIDENNQQFTDSRWSLFQWLVDLNAEFISNVNKTVDSPYIRLVKFTLKLLLNDKLITSHEADIILQTELDGWISKNVPVPNDDFPRYVELDWVLTAHKYTIAFELVCHCLELSGLRKESTLILFNALKFHKNMHMARNDSGHDDNMERQIQNMNLN